MTTGNEIKKDIEKLEPILQRPESASQLQPLYETLDCFGRALKSLVPYFSVRNSYTFQLGIRGDNFTLLRGGSYVLTSWRTNARKDLVLLVIGSVLHKYFQARIAPHASEPDEIKGLATMIETGKLLGDNNDKHTPLQPVMPNLWPLLESLSELKQAILRTKVQEHLNLPRAPGQGILLRQVQESLNSPRVPGSELI